MTAHSRLPGGEELLGGLLDDVGDGTVIPVASASVSG
jgi:hypothetical protein